MKRLFLTAALALLIAAKASADGTIGSSDGAPAPPPPPPPAATSYFQNIEGEDF